MSRILLTGASGFIGRPTLDALTSRGHEVHAVGFQRSGSGSGAHWHEANLLDEGAGARLVGEVEPELLVHLAWVTEPGRFWTSPENERWVARSRELLEAFAERGGRRAVVAGTCGEYDWSAEGDFNEESTPLNPATPYGQAKLDLYTAGAELAERTGMELAWGRYFFLYGPGEHPDRLAASVTRSVLAGEPALCSPGTQIRDFLYVEDAGDALAALLESSVRGPVNLASGAPIALSELIERIAEAAGGPELVRLGAFPIREGDPPRIGADVGRLNDEVGWNRLTPLAEGVDRTVSWWREQPAATGSASTPRSR